MIHTVELSKMITKEMYEQTIALLNMGYYKRCYLTTDYAEQGFSLIRLYKFQSKKAKEEQQGNDIQYLYMIAITVNIGRMFGGDEYFSNSTLAFTPDFVKSIYLSIYELIPCLEQAQRYRESNTHWWNEVNAFKAHRIDFAFDFKTMHEQYLTLINRGYSLRKNSYERTYYDDEALQEAIDDDEPNIKDVEGYNADVNYVYYKGKSLNINIYNKAKQLKNEHLPMHNDNDYNFLRLEVQVKKSKLNAIVAKFHLKGRELQYLITPEVEHYVLCSYVQALTGTGVYVTYQKALQIIDSSNYTSSKKQRLKRVIKAVSDKHGIAKVLEQIENGTVTDLGKLTTVQSYLRDIHKMGINPVTISARMNVPKQTLASATENNDIDVIMLPSLIDAIEVYSKQIQIDQQQGREYTDEDYELIDNI